MRARQAIQRREFLARVCDLGRIGIVGMVAGRWPETAAHAATSVASGVARTGDHVIMLDKVTVSVFTECLGHAFRIHAESGSPLAVKLIEATALGSQSKARGAPTEREPFSIVFRGPTEPVLPQKIYTLEHAGLGRFELFLVPIGPDAHGMRYEAVFN